MTKSSDEDLVTYIKQLLREREEVPKDDRQARNSFTQRIWGVLKYNDKL